MFSSSLTKIATLQSHDAFSFASYSFSSSAVRDTQLFGPLLRIVYERAAPNVGLEQHHHVHRLFQLQLWADEFHLLASNSNPFSL